MRVVNVSEMRDIEERANRDYGLTSEILMEHAGHSVADSLAKKLGGDIEKRHILVLVGPGNNGGDGRVMGRYLSRWGAKVTYYVWKDRRLEDGADSPTAPAAQGTSALQAGAADEALKAALKESSVVVDALLGTGNSRPLDSSMRDLLSLVAGEKELRPDLLIVALDLPTGLNADTGMVDEGTLPADMTVTLAFAKQGLLFFPGANYVGELEVGSIGLPDELPIPRGLELIDAATVRSLLPKRPLDSNKGTFGKVMVMAGSPSYPGSAYLACTAAARIGAGLVTLAVIEEMASIYAGKFSEITLHLLPKSDQPPSTRAQSLLAALNGYRALVIGPGLGQSEATKAFLLEVFAGIRRMPEDHRPLLVVDADGLNNLSAIPSWWEQLPKETVITPHPGEMARLRGGIPVSGGEIDRLQISQTAARDWNLTLVLKGAHTLIAGTGGLLEINAPGNPALATAGTGDVLAGTIGGLLAQGLVPFNAACSGVYLHSRAGFQVSDRLGDAGLLASDLLGELPLALHAAKLK
ncbi:MAG: NAD(P)H-hydrate dehydratase [Ktedonobacterales bacterium]